jgi:hypothetical protein
VCPHRHQIHQYQCYCSPQHQAGSRLLSPKTNITITILVSRLNKQLKLNCSDSNLINRQEPDIINTGTDTGQHNLTCLSVATRVPVALSIINVNMAQNFLTVGI